MHEPPDSTPINSDLHTLSEAVVLLMEHPAAIVADGELVIAHNPAWEEVTRCPPGPGGSLTLSRSLHDFSSTQSLVAALRCGSPTVGVIRAQCVAPASPTGQTGESQYTMHWRLLQARAQSRALAMVVLQKATELEQLTSLISSQRARVDRVLIRQTLIEENERRRIGRALHDVVSQDLAHLRADLAQHPASAGSTTSMITTLDRVIEDIRTLSFELSPPVLEHLGLLSALRWLAEHMGQRYNAQISVADDSREPPLSTEERTVVFRAVRELLNNAVKHAVGAEVVISCLTGRELTRIVVRDSGPGFDAIESPASSQEIQRYGLLSVEQQVRGIGGQFDLATQLGEGTRATILLPIQPNKKDAAHEKRHDRDPGR